MVFGSGFHSKGHGHSVRVSTTSWNCELIRFRSECNACLLFKGSQQPMRSYHNNDLHQIGWSITMQPIVQDILTVLLPRKCRRHLYMQVTFFAPLPRVDGQPLEGHTRHPQWFDSEELAGRENKICSSYSPKSSTIALAFVSFLWVTSGCAVDHDWRISALCIAGDHTLQTGFCPSRCLLVVCPDNSSKGFFCGHREICW